MATSAITPPQARHVARPDARAIAASLARLARRGAIVLVQLLAACFPLIAAAWLVYPMSPAGVLLAGVAGMLAGVWLGAWLATPDQSRADQSRADQSRADQSRADRPSDGGRADV